MTDPMQALRQLQQALDSGRVPLGKCDIFPELSAIADQPAGRQRLTIANVQGGRVLAIAMFVATARESGGPCYQLGYAVVEHLRNQGLATGLVKNAMAELLQLLKGHGAQRFYVEAVVALGNEASNALARRLISDAPKQIEDAFSGEPAWRYVKLVQT